MLAPGFDLPDGWRDTVAEVTVRSPEGTEFAAAAKFLLTHFRRPENPVQIIVLLPDTQKSRVPPGSRVLGSPELKAALTAS